MRDERIKANTVVLDQSIDEKLDKKFGEFETGLDKSIDEKFDKKFDEKLEPVLEAIRDGFEETATKAELRALKHDLMDHTDRAVAKAVGGLRAELREARVLP